MSESLKKAMQLAQKDLVGVLTPKHKEAFENGFTDGWYNKEAREGYYVDSDLQAIYGMAWALGRTGAGGTGMGAQ